MIEQISENRAKEMVNEINQLFDNHNNSVIINDIIKNLIGRGNF